MEPHSVFNNLDYIVVGIVLMSGLLALMRGFLREVFSLIAWAGAYFAAINFYAPVVPWMHHYIKNDKTAEWGAMAVVFVVVLIVLIILGNLICSQIKGRAMTWIDRSLGLLYGLARGALVISLIYMSARMVIWPDIDTTEAGQQEDKDRNPPPDLLLEAKTRPLMARGADLLAVLVPKEMMDKTLKSVETQKARVESDSSGSSSEKKSSPVDIDKLFNRENP